MVKFYLTKKGTAVIRSPLNIAYLLSYLTTSLLK